MKAEYLFRPKDWTLLDRVRDAAARQDLTIRQYIERALVEALKKEKK